MFSKSKKWFKENSQELYVAGLVLLMIVIASIPASIVTIDAGQQGVVWHRLFGGTNLTKAYREGTRFKLPWDKIFLYNMRLTEVHTNFDALSKNGVKVDVEVSFRFHPNSDNLGELHKFVGPDYLKVLVMPKIGSHIRELFANYEPEQLYSIHRQAIESTLLNNVRGDKSTASFDGNHQINSDRLLQYVVFENIYITGITLPERVVKAIEDKESLKQSALAYDHRLEIAHKEKERKKIEAQGVRDFQDTINKGISDKYLTWKGIEATLELAKSTNAKVVVIGSAKDGLPLILGNGYTDGPQRTPVDNTNAQKSDDNESKNAAKRNKDDANMKQPVGTKSNQTSSQ
ncbi:MAG: prohibitin 2 [Phenylobacterium sp.]|jgi:prohibitin 2